MAAASVANRIIRFITILSHKVLVGEIKVEIGGAGI
jgi:hypothetical protein